VTARLLARDFGRAISACSGWSVLPIHALSFNFKRSRCRENISSH